MKKPSFEQIHLGIVITIILIVSFGIGVIITNRKANCYSEAALNGGLSSQPDFCYDFSYPAGVTRGASATKKD